MSDFDESFKDFTGAIKASPLYTAEERSLALWVADSIKVNADKHIKELEAENSNLTIALDDACGAWKHDYATTSTGEKA